jgi:hypothetical protein
MKHKPRSFFFVGMITFTLAIFACLPLQARLAARAQATNAAPIVNRMTLRQGAGNTAALANPSNNLVYHGGPVMSAIATINVIFWYPTASQAVAPGYNSLVLRYLSDSGRTSLYRNNRQYHGNVGAPPAGAFLRGIFTDTRPYPALTLLDSDIQAEVSHVQSLGVFHQAEPVDTVYFVFLAPRQNLCFDVPPPGGTCFNNIFCAYHNFFGSSIYAAMPYVNFVGTATDGSTVLPGCSTPTTPNNNLDADSEINVMSHEQNESATDPYLNAWFDADGNEIGDKCNFTFGPLNAIGADIVVFGHNPYILQEEWDNRINGCTIAGP